MQTPKKPGFYGKMYVLGDFVSRRLPARFIETWDAWLQDALSASRKQLGPDWLNVYLTSPIWRFILSPGICGDSAWAGILMPSVDRVNRYFPLTLAVQIEKEYALPATIVHAAEWYGRLENLGLSALDDEFDVTEFDRKLQKHPFELSTPTSEDVQADEDVAQSTRKFTFNMTLDKAGQMGDAFARLGDRLLRERLPVYSLWSTSGSENIPPTFRAYEDLPYGKAYCELLADPTQSGAGGDTAKAAAPLEAVECPDPQETHASAEVLKGLCFKWQSDAQSNVGKHRTINEDAFLQRPEIGLWAVADGMGGHSAGDVASQAVIEGLNNLSASGNLETLAAGTIECLHQVNADLLARADTLGPDKTIGATVVVMLAAGERCAAIWVGDSRLYRYRHGNLSQLTHDHTPAGELARQEGPLAETAYSEPDGNIITRAIGGEPELLVDSVTFDAEEGDIYLLCSDGLNKELTPPNIAAILGSGGEHESSQELIASALAHGGRDNVTVIVVHAAQIC